MKHWPKDTTKVVNFEDIAKPIKKVFETIFPDVDWYIESVDLEEEIRWKGLPFGSGVAHVVPNPEVLLSQKGIDDAREQGRDVLDTLIMIAINLGFEQGRRYQKNDTGPLESILKKIEKITKK